MSAIIATAAVFLIVGIVIGSAWANWAFVSIMREKFPDLLSNKQPDPDPRIINLGDSP